MTRSLILAVLLMAGEVCVGFIKGFAPVGGVILMANAFGTGLSPSVEPLRVSMASPLPSLSQGER